MSSSQQNKTGTENKREQKKESGLIRSLKKSIRVQFFGRSAPHVFNDIEVMANKFVMLGIVMCVVLTTIFSVVASFMINTQSIEVIASFWPIPTYIIALCTAAIVFIFRWNRRWLKYVLVGAVMLMIILIMIDDSENQLFFPFFPVLLSCLYFNPRFTFVSAAVMAVSVPSTLLISDALGYFDASALVYSAIYSSDNLMLSILIIRTLETVGFLIFPVILSVIGRNLILDQIELSRKDAGINKELSLASSIQSGMLPKPLPLQNEFEVSAMMYPAAEIGGDYYDYFMTDEKHLVFMAADVSGHGIPASLFMANVKAYITAYTHCGLSVDLMMNKVNRELCASNSQKLFVTAWIGYFNLETGELAYVNAGHTPPAIMKKGGEFSLLKSKHDFVLGRKRLIRYHEHWLTLSEGDRLFIYTDGVTETKNNAGEFFGEERLTAALNKCCNISCSDLLQSVSKGLEEFRGGADVCDDITMLAFEYKQRFVQPDSYQIEVMSDNEGYEKIMNYMTKVLTDAGCNPMILSNISVAVSELISNIIRHAYDGDPNGKISLSISTFSHRAKIVISDGGRYFNPLDVNCDSCKTRVMNHIRGGLGIFMVRKLADDVRYRYENNQNITTIEAEY
ncbi:MAG TPA: SpoIIE family protein phosphatase [Methanocorpusculum sp.]|nr:SpoIIE family protein phosphatase [Methanocorpusculum sp.]